MKVRSKAKRFFAILLSLAMVVSMMPTIAFAADPVDVPDTVSLSVDVYLAVDTLENGQEYILVAEGTDGKYYAMNNTSKLIDLVIEYKEETKKLRGQIDELNETIKSLLVPKTSTEIEVKMLRLRVEEYEDEIAEKDREITELYAELAELRKEQ